MTNEGSLRPEQQTAIDYARRAGTEAAVEDIRSKMATTFAALEAWLDEIPVAAVLRKPSPDSWSIHEVVDHLVESHRPAVGELETLVRGESLDSDPIPAGLQSEKPFETPWPEMVERLRRVHADLLVAVARTDEDTPLHATVPVAMVVKCQQEDGSMRPVHWQESFDWKAYAILLRAHTLEHANQIRRLTIA